MATTYQAIATVTVGSGGAANIAFTSIPATYTDLVILVSARTNAPHINGSFYLEFNGSTSSRTARRLFGNGSSASSDTNLQIEACGANATGAVFGNATIYIPNYTSSNYKSIGLDFVTENNATGAYQMLSSWLWSNTSAINQIVLQDASSSGSFDQYSTATLYGIKNS